jgi:hypothetical protein
MTMTTKTRTRPLARRAPLAAAVTALLAGAGSSHAFSIDSGNPDVAMRLDTTVRYNLAARANKVGVVGNNVQYDESEYKFADRGDIVTNRLDLLPEFDFVYKKRNGFRVSAAAWYDHAYNNTNTYQNPALAGTAGSTSAYAGGQYSPYVKRYYRGPSGELLDAFAFGGVDIGEMALSFKVGQHSTIWGESLFTTTHGINYSQSPLDLAKAFATPGIESKELFRPLTQLSAQLTVSPELSVAAQYFLDWDYSRLPESGTYLGIIDMGFVGPSGFPGLGTNNGISRPDKRGDWGVSARWSPQWLDGTMGFYYRNFTDKTFALFRDVATTATASSYKQFFAEDIDLFGLSLSKQVGSVSVGAELSYRNNMPLYGPLLQPASGAGVNTAQLYPNGLPALIGNSYAARGRTLHAVLNGVAVLGAAQVGDFKLFDTATVLGELTYSHLLKVTDNAAVYQGIGYGVCDESRRTALGTAFRNKWDGCATRSAVGMQLSFTPTWLQVLPGVDLLAPMSVSRGLYGNSPVTLGGNQNNGSYSLGLAADVYAKYRIDLRYVDYFGTASYGAQAQTGQQMVRANGLSTLLKDRGFVALTLKATF